MAHVVLMPFPGKTHLKPMLLIAELLCHNGIQVTFVNTDHNNHQLLQSTTNSDDNLNQHLRFMFLSISDSLSPAEGSQSHTRKQNRALMRALDSVSYKQKFKDFMVSLGEEGEAGGGGWQRPTCVIADGFVIFAIEAAVELHIPVVAYRPNASVVWTFFHISKLIELGEVPFSDDMDKSVTCIPGMETLLRRRDLPSFCRLEDDDPILEFFIKQASTMAKASALILNTFQELEAPMIKQVGSVHSKIYPIGPFHSIVRVSRAKADWQPLKFDTGIEENRACLTWLDSQQPNSVLYVSFGSLVTLSHAKLLELWYGLVNSGKHFLWVIRPDMIHDKENPTPPELMLQTKNRGYIVDWAPQEEILVHRSIGGFLTHSGWKSTIESISAGVPMICWPQFSDQQVNSRCVSELWKIGLDMKDMYDRSTVEMMVRDLMDNKSGDIMNEVTLLSRLAQESVMELGSSDKSLKRLIEDIKLNNLG